MRERINNFFLFQAGNKHDDDGDGQEGSCHLREPPAAGHNTPHHNREGNTEQGKNQFAAHGEFDHSIRVKPFHVVFAETFPVFIGIRKSRIRFNLFRIPVEIIDDTSSAQYQTDSAETYAFGKGNTGGVGSDYDREGVNG